MNYTDNLAKEAQKRSRYLYAALGIFYNMKEEDASPKDGEVLEVANVLETEFTEAMNSDFNTPLALTKLVQTINTLRDFAGANETVGKKAKEDVMKKVLEFSRILGLFEGERYKETIAGDAKELIAKRDALRRGKKFEEADKIRKELEDKHGIMVEDTEYGPAWYRR